MKLFFNSTKSVLDKSTPSVGDARRFSSLHLPTMTATSMI